MTNNEKNYKVFNIIWNTLRIVKPSMEPMAKNEFKNWEKYK